MLLLLFLPLFYASVSGTNITISPDSASLCVLSIWNGFNVKAKSEGGIFCTVVGQSGSGSLTEVSYYVSKNCVIEISFEVDGEFVSYTHIDNGINGWGVASQW